MHYIYSLDLFLNLVLMFCGVKIPIRNTLEKKKSFARITEVLLKYAQNKHELKLAKINML